MGLFDFLGGKKDSGRDAGNAFTTDAVTDEKIRGQLSKFLDFQSDPNVTGTGASDFATNQVMNNPMLGQLFGKGGTLERTGQEEKDLAGRGYSLKPEDYEAYGQMSDQMARQFGTQESSLANALAGRGLSFSGGAAGGGFSNIMGNKQEQIGQYARQIANDRMNMNMQRLGQTRNFLSNLANQGSQNIQSQWGRNLQGEQEKFNQAGAKNAAAFQRLSAQQDQSNENLQQRQQTEKQMPWAQALQGVGNYVERNMLTRPSVQGPGGIGVGGAQGPNAQADTGSGEGAAPGQYGPSMQDGSYTTRQGAGQNTYASNGGMFGGIQKGLWGGG